MPITWVVDPGERFLELTVADPYTADEWRAAVLQVLDDPTFQQCRAILVDRRHAEPPTTAFVATVVRFMAAHVDALALRTAVLVRDSAAFGMTRMTALTAEFESAKAIIHPFYDRDDAVRWLTR
jgi:hypothetical protein